MIVFDLRAIDLMKIWRGATAHHSLLSLYSLQSLPLQAWQLCNMITPDVKILDLFLSNIPGKHFPHFNVTATACPWEYKMVVREGGTSPTKAFLRRSETSEHTCKNPEDICKKRNTFAKKTNTFTKKSEHICKKKCNTFAVFLKSLKRRQSWNEGGWIVRDHLQDTFGSFPKWRMILMLVGAEEIIPGWGKEWENSEKVRCCTVPSLPVQTPVPPKHWQYLSMLFAQGIHFIPHSP